MPTDNDLNALSEVQKGELARYYEGTGNAEDVLGTMNPLGKLYRDAGGWVMRQFGKEMQQTAPTRADIAKRYRGQ